MMPGGQRQPFPSGLMWLGQALGTVPHSGAGGERYSYVLVPSASRPQMLLSPGERGAAWTMLRRHSDAASLKVRVAKELMAWKQGVLAIESYRLRRGIEDGERALGREPRSGAARADYVVTRSKVSSAREAVVPRISHSNRSGSVDRGEAAKAPCLSCYGQQLAKRRR